MYFTDRKRHRRFLPKLVLSLVLVGVSVFSSPAKCEASGYALTEAQVKAAFVFNFCKFVRWPDEIQKSCELSVCLLGESEVNRVLKSFEGNKIGSRILKISKCDPLKNPMSCHALYISADAMQGGEIHQLLEKLRNTPVLTISDAPGFTNNRGIIQLIKQGNKIRFNINLAAAKAAGLKVSSKLLKLARIVFE